MTNRFLIGRGELLTYDIPPPSKKPSKSHPYSLAEAKKHLLPQLASVAAQMRDLPKTACPSDIAVAKLNLHPAYIAKSYFPNALLRHTNLISVGSRTVQVRPRTDLRKAPPEFCESTQLFVAGTRESFFALPNLANELEEESGEALQFAEIEDFLYLSARDRIKGKDAVSNQVFEVGLHLLPNQSIDRLCLDFKTHASTCGFKLNREFEFPVGRMLFIAVTGDGTELETLAQFSLLRVVRPMPPLRGSRPLARSTPISVGFSLPTAQPLSDEPKVAILDGGLPSKHVIGPFLNRYQLSDPNALEVPEYSAHGLGVTGAFLFGPIEPNTEVRRPYSYVDHYRVLDADTDKEDPFELYRTLAHIEEVLLSRQYQFLNLSLGPELPIEDSDVHAWTAVIDTLLSDGETLMTVAVGNNGDRNSDGDLNRIQVPSDSVNALSVGAANSTGESWGVASYSARGPGRSPGRRKPDVVAFGGCPKEYFHVSVPGTKAELAASMGTSYSAPLALRTAVGVRAVLGDEVHPLTIKGLLVHSAAKDSTGNVNDVGWGRVTEEINDIIMCGDGVARIIYQGLLRPGKYLRAPVPLPNTQLKGNVQLSATFCYACSVDVEDSAAYTKAGLAVTFRPNSDKSAGKQPNSRSFFSQSTFRTEDEQRSDLGKWETVIHASRKMRGTTLNNATFDVHYNARESGGVAGPRTELIRYALILTVEAPKNANLYSDILASHSVLKPIEPRVSLPIRA